MSSPQETRFDIAHKTDSYGGATEYGSGATGGAGFGNKSTDLNGTDSEFRFGSAHDTRHYSNATEYGSGATAGVGWGNKTSQHRRDSTTGLLMEKVGALLHNDGLVEKGHARREAAGYGKD